jgi:hypothetical protein
VKRTISKFTQSRLDRRRRAAKAPTAPAGRRIVVKSAETTPPVPPVAARSWNGAPAEIEADPPKRRRRKAVPDSAPVPTGAAVLDAVAGDALREGNEANVGPTPAEAAPGTIRELTDDELEQLTKPEA